MRGRAWMGMAVLGMTMALGVRAAADGPVAPSSEAPPAVAPAERGLTWSVGGGVFVEPEYEGGDEFAVDPFPVVGLNYGVGGRDVEVFASLTDGIGVLFGPEARLSYGLALLYGGGRDEEDGDLLRGLPEIDDAAIVVASASYAPVEAISLTLDATRFLGGSDGTQITFGAETGLPAGRRTFVGLGLFGTYADESYVDTYFSVTDAQAAPSVAGLAPFEAKAGLHRVDATLTAAYELTPRATLLGELAVGQLLGDAADSPLVEEEVQPSLGVGVLYEF